MKIKRLFWILFLLNLLNYIDRQVLYAVFPLLQADLQLTDFQLGILASVFMVVYMCYAPVMGYLAGRIARPKLIGLSALIWSGATLCCAGAKNYVSLLVPRALVGVGEGGFTTLAQPFLAEHYPKKNHAWVLALFGLALPVGSALGYVLGGLLGQQGGWRLAFAVVGFPGVLLGIWALNGLQERPLVISQHKHTPFKAYLTLFHNRSFLYVCLAQAMSTFVMGGLAAWMPMYLHRYAGLGIAHAGTYFGILVITGGILGTLLGGKIAARWLAHCHTAYYHIIGICFLTALPFCWGALYIAQTAGILTCLAIALTLLFMPTGAIAAALVKTTSVEVRTMAFAVNIFIIHVLGDAISPTLVGWGSNMWNLKTAVFVCTLMLLPGAWFSRKAKQNSYPET